MVDHPAQVSLTSIDLIKFVEWRKTSILAHYKCSHPYERLLFQRICLSCSTSLENLIAQRHPLACVQGEIDHDEHSQTLSSVASSSAGPWYFRIMSKSVVLVIPIGLNTMPLGFLAGPEEFECTRKGLSEEYGPRMVSEGARTADPRFTNKGRKVAIEAAMTPRFISSLSFVQSQSLWCMPLPELTQRIRH